MAASRDGAEAVPAVASQTFGLVFMDIEMPLMNGYEAAELSRAQECGSKRTPIVAMTAHVDDRHVRQSLEAGMDGHVTKPISRQLLEEAVAQYAKGKPGNSEQ